MRFYVLLPTRMTIQKSVLDIAGTGPLQPLSELSSVELHAPIAQPLFWFQSASTRHSPWPVRHTFSVWACRQLSKAGWCTKCLCRQLWRVRSDLVHLRFENLPTRRRCANLKGCLQLQHVWAGICGSPRSAQPFCFRSPFWPAWYVFRRPHFGWVGQSLTDQDSAYVDQSVGRDSQNLYQASTPSKSRYWKKLRDAAPVTVQFLKTLKNSHQPEFTRRKNHHFLTAMAPSTRGKSTSVKSIDGWCPNSSKLFAFASSL